MEFPDLRNQWLCFGVFFGELVHVRLFLEVPQKEAEGLLWRVSNLMSKYLQGKFDLRDRGRKVSRRL